jgi:hypothetical protein
LAEAVALCQTIHHHWPELAMISHKNDLHSPKQQWQQALGLGGLCGLINEHLHQLAISSCGAFMWRQKDKQPLPYTPACKVRSADQPSVHSITKINHHCNTLHKIASYDGTPQFPSEKPRSRNKQNCFLWVPN